METSSPLKAALAYQRRGLSVIPCDAASKRSLVPWRAYQATAPDEDEIRETWQRWPDADVGIVTGGVSGIVVIDVDDARPECIGEVQARFGPTGRVARTPSGGAHLYYAHSGEPVRNSARLPCFDFPVDVRGDGGYVIAPPSPGYVWEREYPFDSLPVTPDLTPTMLSQVSRRMGRVIARLRAQPA